MAEDLRVACSLPQKGGEHFDGSTLAGTIRAEEPEKLAFFDIEVYAVDGFGPVGIDYLKVVYEYYVVQFCRALRRQHLSQAPESGVVSLLVVPIGYRGDGRARTLSSGLGFD